MEQLFSRLPANTSDGKVFLIEAVVLVAVFVVFTAFPNLGQGLFRRVERALNRLASRKALAILLIGAIVLIGRLAILPIHPTGVTTIHDEFCYLLQADTFASGRLTNPTHPMWVHFESISIFHQPTYTAKYPPAQGLFLAVGQALFGHSWIGVLLSCVLMSIAIMWMLQGWLPHGWAFLGGSWCAFKIGLFHYWSTSYWGGAVAAIGGALVIGALPRITKRPRILDGILLGVGLAILANSRPYEGLLVALPVGFILLVWMIRQRKVPLGLIFSRGILPTALIIMLTAGLMGYFNWAVTGDPLRLPYQNYRDTYKCDRSFVWQGIDQLPTYRHEKMQQFLHGEFRDFKERTSSIQNYSELILKKVREAWRDLVGFTALIPLVFLPWLIRDRQMRRLNLIALFTIAGQLLVRPFHSHYLAPAIGVLYIYAVQGMRHLHKVGRRGRQTGKGLVRAIVVVLVAMVGINAALASAGLLNMLWFDTEPAHKRSEIIEDLEKDGGKHLVLVRYKPTSYYYFEWVYNKADIDEAKVVWAREMDEEQNEKLIKYFENRKLWLLKAYEKPYRLVSYPFQR